jgi:hypothetical protein
MTKSTIVGKPHIYLNYRMTHYRPFCLGMGRAWQILLLTDGSPGRFCQALPILSYKNSTLNCAMDMEAHTSFQKQP